jgi:hypothetical protein
MFETYFFFRVFNYLPVRGRDAVPWESVPVEVVPVPVILLFFPPAANAATVLVAKTKVRTIKTSLFITTLLCIDNFLFFYAPNLPSQSTVILSSTACRVN